MEYKSNMSNAWKFLGIWLIFMILYDGYYILHDVMKDTFGLATLIGPLFLLPLLYIYVKTIRKACYRLESDALYIELPSDKVSIPYANMHNLEMIAGGKASYGLANANIQLEYLSERGSLEVVTLSLEKDNEFFRELTKRIEAAHASI